MRDWLHRILPGGPLHTWLVDASESALKVVLAAVLFVVLRWLALRGISAVMKPLKARSEREGGSGVTRLQTLEGLTKSSVTYILLFLAAVTVLSQMGINVAAI